MCCADRRNCCPYGHLCAHDGSCIRRGLRYPFSPIQALSSVPASLISTSEDKDNLQEVGHITLSVCHYFIWTMVVKKEAVEKPITLLLPISPLQEPKNNLDQKQRSDHVCEHGLKCRVGQTCCRGEGNNAYFCCPFRAVSWLSKYSCAIRHITVM